MHLAGEFGAIIIEDSDSEKKATEPPVVKKIKINN